MTASLDDAISRAPYSGLVDIGASLAPDMIGGSITASVRANTYIAAYLDGWVSSRRHVIDYGVDTGVRIRW